MAEVCKMNFGLAARLPHFIPVKFMCPVMRDW